MVEIASNHHKQLQEKLQMKCKEKSNNQNEGTHKEKLQDAEVAELRGGTWMEEVEEAIKQTQTGKCPGHSGITYEFWKSCKEPKKNSEEMMIKKP